MHNISDKPINITNVKLVSPLGFIQLSEHGERKSLSDRIGTEITVSGLSMPKIELGQLEFDWKKIQQNIQGTPPKDSQSVTVQPMDNYRVNFNLQAGLRLGLRPRPDTYTISIEVVYTSNGTTHHKQLSTEISIFPPIVGMLGGTLLGSFLGTLIKNIQLRNLEFLLPILLTNLALGFIVGVSY